MTPQPYVVPNMPPEVVEPQRRRWPLAVWIVPDAILAAVTTLVFSLILFLGYFAIRAVQGASLQGALGDGTTAGLPTSLLFALIVVQDLCFVGVVLLRTRLLRKLPLSWLGFRAARPWRLIGLGVLFGLLFFGLNFAVGFVASQLDLKPADQAAQFNLQRGDPLGQILMFLGASVIAPIGEELFFRGYMFKALRESGSRSAIGVLAAQIGVIVGLPLLAAFALGAVTLQSAAPLLLTVGGALVVALLVPSARVRAYVLSAALFSVVHLTGITQGAPTLLVAIFLGGLILAAAFDLTDSLVPGMIAHGINNGIAFAQLLYCLNVLGSINNCG